MASGRWNARRARWMWQGGILWALGCASPHAAGLASLVKVAAPPVAAAVGTAKATLPASGFAIQQVQHEDTDALPAPLPVAEKPAADRYPIDLATALRLAGANNLQIALAAERVHQAQARLQGAQVLWLPSLNAGVAYTKHDGRLQDTQGTVLDASRNAFFVGGGPNLGPAPLTGPGGPPARLFLGLPLADVLFAPLAERQAAQAVRAGFAATFNDTLLQVALAYLDLARAEGQVAVAREAVQNAQELVRLVESRVEAGAASPADGLRAQAELADRRRQLYQAEEAVRIASADLVRLLRLDPAVTLFPLEGQPAPIELVDADVPLPDLLAQGLTSWPELAENQALIRATLARLRQERWRPLVPTVQLGLSAGGFGGGEGSFAGHFGDRVDFDALAVWELRNLGLGNRALAHERASQHRQAHLTAAQAADAIAAEIARAYHQVHYRRQQIEAARAQVKAAAEALPLNFKGILGGQLRAIEAQQAVQGLAAARGQYLAAMIDYNRAQFQLLRALGQSPDSPLCAP